MKRSFLISVIFFLFCLCSKAGNFKKNNIHADFIPTHIFSDCYFYFFNTKHYAANSIEYKTAEHFRYAIFFDIPVEEVSNLTLFRFISYWHGTKYLLGGISKKGIDCSGFVQRLMNEVFCVNLGRMTNVQFEQVAEIHIADLKQGDLVFFDTGGNGLSHVGFYLGDNKFIHASVNKGVCVDDLDSGYYKKAYRASGRVLKSNL